jgi:hypothetical protein
LIFKRKTVPVIGTVNYGGQRQKHGEMPELHIPAFKSGGAWLAIHNLIIYHF